MRGLLIQAAAEMRAKVTALRAQVDDIAARTDCNDTYLSNAAGAFSIKTGGDKPPALNQLNNAN